MASLEGKVAIITGASYGLGRGIAHAFARADARVLLAARSADRLDVLAEQIKQEGGEALAAPCDLQVEEEVDGLFARAIERYGRVDVLVNNAAFLGGGPLENLSSDTWNHAIAVNLTGPFLCTRAAFRVMKPRGGGRIINVASIAAKRVRPDSAPYAATKHALWGLTQVSALEGRYHGIVASCIFPGNIRTEARATPDSDFNREPMMTVEEVASAVLFMAAQPPHLNVLELTLLPNTQQYIGRG